MRFVIVLAAAGGLLLAQTAETEVNGGLAVKGVIRAVSGAPSGLDMSASASSRPFREGSAPSGACAISDGARFDTGARELWICGAGNIWTKIGVSTHTHAAVDLVSGTIAIARLPTAGTAPVAVATTAGALTPTRAAVIDGNGRVASATGTSTDCVRVDGSSGACGGAAGLPDPGGNGIVARTAANTTTPRAVENGDGIIVTNGDGVAGNPRVAADTSRLATVAATRTGGVLTCRTAGTSTAYTCAMTPALLSGQIVAGSVIWIQPHVANAAGAVTITIDGQGPYALKDPLGNDLAASALGIAGVAYPFAFNGTNFLLSTSSGGGGSSLPEIELVPGYCSGTSGAATFGPMFFHYAADTTAGAIAQCDGAGAGNKFPVITFLNESREISVRFTRVRSLTPTLELELGSWAASASLDVRTACKGMGVDVDTAITFNAAQTIAISTSPIVSFARYTISPTMTGCSLGDVLIIRLIRSATPTGTTPRVILAGGRLRW